MRNDSEVQAAARKLFKDVVPERAAELEEMWRHYNPRFNILTDAGPDGLFVLDAGAYRDVRFNHRAMRIFWLASFIAWEGYRAVAEADEAGNINLKRFCEMIAVFDQVLEGEDPEAVTLPEGIPEPGIYPDGKEVPQMRAAAELATLSTGWALLHEVRHLKHQQDGTGAAMDDPPEERRAEEMSCDSFATEFLLDKAGVYAADAGVPFEALRQKREIGIYFALFALALIGCGHWHETDTHPAMEARINAVMQKMESDGTKPSDAIAHMAFVALWNLRPDAPGPFKVH
ncbi:MAG: phage exclusion protein Lit family protein [Pontimonas sp.]